MQSLLPTAGDARHAIAHAADAAAHRAEDAAHQIGSALGDAGNEVSRVAHDSNEAVRTADSQGVDALTGFAHDAGVRAGQLTHEAQEAAVRALHTPTDAASHAAHKAEVVFTDTRHAVEDQAPRVERQFESTLETHRLVVGAVALAAGAALGFALPRTQREDALMGEARDRWLRGATGAATDLAREAAQSIHRLAGDVAHASDRGLAAGA